MQRRTAFLVCCSFGSLLALALSAAAFEFDIEGFPDDPAEPWREFIDGWEAFANWRFMLQELTSLALAALLAALLAYHPRIPRNTGLEAVEQPKAILIYAIIGAAVSEVVLFNPPMAFVIFGVGGLLRFRSLIGSPKDTGRTILAVVVGLACGLKFFPVAILATAFGWVVIWILESHLPITIEIRGLESGSTKAAADAWRRALETSGCRVRHTKTTDRKGRLEVFVLAPFGSDVEELSEAVAVEKDFRGEATWSVE